MDLKIVSIVAGIVGIVGYRVFYSVASFLAVT